MPAATIHSGASSVGRRVEQIRFFHASGHFDASIPLADLLASGVTSLRGAVCYVTMPGARFLRHHARLLRSEASYFVASIDPPTNLKALLELHRVAPGKIYIHLGGITPEAKDVGRSLMHSKVILAEGPEGFRLWVGSHNMTASAIAGGNIEAGAELRSNDRAQWVADAEAHLEWCRRTAEVFDPNQMARYIAIQRERMPLPSDLERARLLVIHAEADPRPSSAPFTVHLLVAPTDFDGYFRMDRGVRLYLHPPGTLVPGQMIDLKKAAHWRGLVTAIVRTAIHPKNNGVAGTFPGAQFELTIADLNGPPKFSLPSTTAVRATTQVVLRIDRPASSEEELYSLSDEPVRHALDSERPPEMWHAIPPEFVEYFTSDSVEEARLVFRRLDGVKQMIAIKGFEETMRPSFNSPRDNEIWGDKALRYETKASRAPVEAFFFVTNYVVKRSGK